MALRRVADVNHLRRIILAENGDEIISIENGVVIGENKPADMRQAEAEALGDNSGDSETGRVTSRVGVAEAGDVLGDHDWGQGIVTLLRGDRLFQPDVATHVVGTPPEPDVFLAAFPELG